jgi:hypothetical protein
MRKMFNSVVPAVLLVLFSLFTQMAQAEESAKQPFKVFKTYGEAIAFYKPAGQMPHATGNVFTGYSLEPFGSAAKAMADAEEKAQKGGINAAVVTENDQHTYDRPPPGTRWYGTYDVVALGAITPVSANPENLLVEIQRNPENAGHFYDLAQQPDYKALTKDYRGIIREKNDEHTRGLALLVRLIALHDGKGCGDELVKWGKYHKNAEVRLESDLALIQLGRGAEVEEILKTEPNNEVKSKVQKSLI